MPNYYHGIPFFRVVLWASLRGSVTLNPFRVFFTGGQCDARFHQPCNPDPAPSQPFSFRRKNITSTNHSSIKKTCLGMAQAPNNHCRRLFFCSGIFLATCCNDYWCLLVTYWCSFDSLPSDDIGLLMVVGRVLCCAPLKDQGLVWGWLGGPALLLFLSFLVWNCQAFFSKRMVCPMGWWLCCVHEVFLGAMIDWSNDD